jgi:mono/diheme cytochrome c family protein
LKTYIGLILLSLATLFETSCVPTGTQSSSLKFTASVAKTVAGTGNFVAFMNVVSSKCISCHSSDVNGNFALLKTEDQWLKSGYAVAGDIYSSSVYTALKGPNASGTMPKDQAALSEADIKSIKTWIENAQNSVGSFSGMNLRLGNRNYVNSVINYVFGKSNTQSVTSGVKYNTLSEKKILYNFASFQGSCDLYSVRNNTNVTLSNVKPPDLNDDWCPQDLEIGVSKPIKVMNPIIGKTNSVRMGYLTQVCEGQVAHTASLEYAMATHLGWVSGDLTVNSANLEKAFQTFYPERPIPAEFSTALMNVANTTTVNKDKWKWIFLTICLSAEWQTP